MGKRFLLEVEQKKKKTRRRGQRENGGETNRKWRSVGRGTETRMKWKGK
jgi:hypothetical protein